MNDVTYGYDLLGRLTSASQTGYALSFTYDALGRVLNQTGPLGTVASEWDIAGRRTRLTWPDTFYVTYDYLLTGETTAIRETGAASGIGVIGTFAYDNLGRRTSLTLGNGVATNYTYDAVSRLNDLKLDFAGTTDDLTNGFAYNPASQIASTARSNDSYAWTSHGSGTTSTTSNGRNQIASWVNTLSYDTKGNVTVDGTYTYGYSSENLLTSLANSATGAVQPTIAFAYDPLMRLAVIDSSNAAFDVDFGYDGQEMVLEGLSSSSTRRYVYGPGIDEPLVGYLVTSTGTSRLWYQGDERGSIARLSNDSGTPGGIGKFDEYGVGGTGRFRFTGQYWLGEANLLYYRARIYDARLGRFLQPDPIGYEAGMNLYGYVGGDPVNFSDPTGLIADVIEPDIIVTAKKPIVVEIIDSGAMGAASAGLRSVGGSLGAAPGGGRPGQPKARPKPEKKEPEDPCAAALAEPGKIKTNTIGVSGVGAIGMVAATGTWVNVKTGTHGFFKTFGFGAGLSAGGSFLRPTYSSLKALVGMSDGYSIGFSIGIPGTPLSIGLGYTSSWNDSGSGSGGGLEVGGAGMPGVGAAGTYTDTQISQCTPGS